jgi:hypothetical protein
MTWRQVLSLTQKGLGIVLGFLLLQHTSAEFPHSTRMRLSVLAACAATASAFTAPLPSGGMRLRSGPAGTQPRTLERLCQEMGIKLQNPKGRTLAHSYCAWGPCRFTRGSVHCLKCVFRNFCSHVVLGCVGERRGQDGCCFRALGRPGARAKQPSHAECC